MLEIAQGLELADQLEERYAQRDTNLLQLDQVQPSFTGLVFADEGLCDTEALCNIHLAEACAEAVLAQDGAQRVLRSAVDRLVHPSSTESNPGYPKSGYALDA